MNDLHRPASPPRSGSTSRLAGQLVAPLLLVALLVACSPSGQTPPAAEGQGGRRDAEISQPGGQSQPSPPVAEPPPPAAAPPAAAPPVVGAAPTPRSGADPAPSNARGPLVLFLGDSLTAGYGLAEEQAFPALVGEALEGRGVEARVVNAGVSGDTTAGGLARLDWLLRQQPDVVVVALGGNDGLRGLPLQATEENLRRIIEASRAAGAEVLLAGMLIPPNYGPDYTTAFAELYPRLAEEQSVPLLPFLLEGVAAEPELNLPDGIHPNARGQQRVAEVVLPHLLQVLERLPDRTAE